MSTRESAYSMIDELTDEQFEAIMVILKSMQHNTPKTEDNVDELDKMMGMFHDAADISKIPLEKSAWATAAAEKHLKILEDMQNENS